MSLDCSRGTCELKRTSTRVPSKSGVSSQRTTPPRAPAQPCGSTTCVSKPGPVSWHGRYDCLGPKRTKVASESKPDGPSGVFVDPKLGDQGTLAVLQDGPNPRDWYSWRLDSSHPLYWPTSITHLPLPPNVHTMADLHFPRRPLFTKPIAFLPKYRNRSLNLK